MDRSGIFNLCVEPGAGWFRHSNFQDMIVCHLGENCTVLCHTSSVLHSIPMPVRHSGADYLNLAPDEGNAGGVRLDGTLPTIARARAAIIGGSPRIP